jgi:hypothetical protein
MPPAHEKIGPPVTNWQPFEPLTLFPVTVELMRDAVASNISMPPELSALFPLTVELMSVRLEPKSASMPPPKLVPALFPVTRTFTKTSADAT